MYRSLLRHKRERLAAVLGRRELGDDSLARRVRDKVVVGDEEGGGVEAALDSLQVYSQNARCGEEEEARPPARWPVGRTRGPGLWRNLGYQTSKRCRIASRRHQRIYKCISDDNLL